MRFSCLLLLLSFSFVKIGNAANELFYKNMFKEEKIVYLDLGLSSSLLLSDLSNQTFATGLGSQFSVGFVTTAKKPTGFKIQIQKIQLKQNNWRKTETPDSNSYFRNFEQEWTHISAGIEKRGSTRLLNWYWDSLFGLSFGRKSRLQIQGNDSTDSLINTEEPTRSGIHFTAAAGIRKKIDEQFSINASLRTFLLFGRIYSDEYKEQNFILLPVLSSVGVEYSF